MISRSQMNRQLYNMGGEGVQQTVQPQMDPQQAIATIVKMLVEQGIPLEQAKKIAIQMIQAVAEGGMQEMSDERVEARFGGRIGYANGGIGKLVNREQYGFGSVFKSVGKAISGVAKGVTNAVKSVVKSPIGKIALTAAAMYYAPMAFGQAPGLAGYQSGWGALKSGLLGTVEAGTGLYGGGLFSGVANAFGGAGGLSSLIPGKGSLLSAGAGFLGGMFAGGAKPPKPEDYQTPEEYQQAVAQYEKLYGANLGGTQTTLPSSANNPFYAANGGRIGYQNGGIGDLIKNVTKQEFFGSPTPMMANGGRMGYAKGNSVEEKIMRAPQIAMEMGMPVGNPRQNQQGVAELDYRDEGGFVPPIGVKERADDIPAMLSNNEFVFTADAVKNAGGGDPNVGARKMYVLMKKLENGGIA